jgi:hypothetical protein
MKCVESEPPPPPAGLSCLIHRNAVYAERPVRFVHGWYVVSFDRIVQRRLAASPEPGTQLFYLSPFAAQSAEARIDVRTGWKAHPAYVGPEGGAEVVEEDRIDLPEGARLVEVFTAGKVPYQPVERLGPVRVGTEYRTLWEGYLIKDEKVLKRIVYAARVAGVDEPTEAVWPPSGPAPTRAAPAPARPEFEFGGVRLSERTELIDIAIRHELAIALKIDAIRSDGGKPTDESRIEVRHKSKRDESGREFIVYRDPDRRVEYIQVGVFVRGEIPQMHWYGPFALGRVK